MKRHRRLICVCLVLGAIITLAVSWFLALSDADYRRTWHGLVRISDKRCVPYDRYVAIGRTRLRWGNELELRDDSHWWMDYFRVPYWSMGSEIKPSSTGDTIYEDGYGWPMRAMRAVTSTRRMRGGAVDATASQETGFLLPERESEKPGPPETWPFWPGAPDPVPFRVLPVRPIVLGLAVDTVIYGAIIGIVPAFVIAIQSVLRRRRAQLAGLCPECRYDLRGGPHERCPECGAEMKPAAAKVT